MKALFTLNGPNAWKAPNIWLLRAVEAFRREGIEPEVVFAMTVPGPCGLREKFEAAGCRTYAIARTCVEGFLPELLTVTSRSQPDVFVPHITPMAYFATPVLHRAGIPVVASLRSDDRFYHDLIEQFMTKRGDFQVDAAVAVSSSLAEQAAVDFPGRVVTAPSGAPVSEHRARFPDDGSFKVGYFGRIIERQKRVSDVCRLFLDLTKSHPGLEANFFGDGPERPNLERFLRQRNGSLPRVHYRGLIKPDEMQAVMSRHQGFVLLSEYEGLSTALVEAMSVGLVPVVRYTRSGAGDVIADGENGFLVESTDEAADKVLQLSSEPATWLRMSNAALESFRARWSIDIGVEKWAELMRRVVENRGGTRRRLEIPPVDQLRLPPPSVHLDGIRKEDIRLSDRPVPISSAALTEAPPACDFLAAGELCIARRKKAPVSETFINHHVQCLAPEPGLLWGDGCCLYDRDDRLVLPLAFARSLRMEREKVITPGYDKAIASHLQEKGYRLVLIEYGRTAAHLYRACQLAGIPYVIHFHGYDASNRIVLAYLKEDYREMFKGASSIVVVSKLMIEQVARLGAPRGKIILNPYGVDPGLSRHGADPGASNDLLYLGRFVAKKSPVNVIQAFALAARRVSSGRLIMVGEGELRGKAEALVDRLGLRDRVIFKGALSHELAMGYLQKARALVQHSVTAEQGDTEGLPNTVLEAGMMGIPVIATRHAGIPDVVTHLKDGFLVEEGDVIATVRAMVVMMSDPGLARRMGRHFQEKISRTHTLNQSIAGLQNILARAL